MSSVAILSLAALSALWLDQTSGQTTHFQNALDRWHRIGELIRNIGLFILGAVGLPLAIWRSWLAQEQHGTNQAQLTAQQAATAQSDAQHRANQAQERFTRAVDHLKDDDEIVKRGGIMTLARLVHDPEMPDRQDVLDMLSAFIKGLEPLRIEAVFPPTWVNPLAELAIKTLCQTPLDDSLRLDLRHCDLTGADLTEADLTAANLAEAKLIRADLSHSDLAAADLSEADLTGASLRRTSLKYANLIETDLTTAELTWTDLTECDLTEANLTGANLTRADLTGAVLEHSDLTEANLDGTILTSTDLSGANLDSVSGLVQAQLDLACQEPFRKNSKPKNLPDELIWDEQASIRVRPVNRLLIFRAVSQAA